MLRYFNEGGEELCSTESGLTEIWLNIGGIHCFPRPPADHAKSSRLIVTGFGLQDIRRSAIRKASFGPRDLAFGAFGLGFGAFGAFEPQSLKLGKTQQARAKLR